MLAATSSQFDFYTGYVDLHIFGSHYQNHIAV